MMPTEKGVENIVKRIADSYHEEHRDVLWEVFQNNPELTNEENSLYVYRGFFLVPSIPQEFLYQFELWFSL